MKFNTHLVVLATDETIAGAQTISSEAGYRPGSLSADDLMVGLFKASEPKIQQNLMK